MTYSTKFRAFQLDTPGSLFSFYKKNIYTLIEARLPKGTTQQESIELLRNDLSFHNKTEIDTLHITSWDSDHCTYNDLVQIINQFRPQTIEIPSYYPESDDGKLCRSLIMKYDAIHQKYAYNVKVISKDYINSLTEGKENETNDIVYHSLYQSENKNDMSLIRLFRSLGFNVLSLGDCESSDIAERLMAGTIIKNEVDVLILAHHGADNGFTTAKLMDTLNPKIAICSSNYDNQYDHPRQEIRDILSQRNIPLMTTKRGDVIIYQLENMNTSVAVNMAGNNEIEESREGFIPKRFITPA